MKGKTYLALATYTSIEVEQSLIERAKKGDRHAYGELIVKHRQAVVNVVYRLCGDSQLAEDMAQEAFIRAWQKLPDFKPYAPFRYWVYRIATNATLDVLRREKDMLDLDEVRVATKSAGLEESASQAESTRQVHQAIRSLPPASRSVLVLREFEGLTYQEIADTLEIPLGTVMSRLSYAREKLRQSLAHLLEEK